MNETIEHAGCTIEIWQDEDSESPREWDNLGTMVCFHHRYNLGDKHGYEWLGDWGALLDEIRAAEGPILWLPVYMYDHSGIGLSTDDSHYPFNCPWDAGRLGIIYVTEKRAESEFSPALMDVVERASRVKGIPRAEVETYSQYLGGEVYGFTVTCGEEEDSCGGFIGYDYCLQEAKEAAEYLAKDAPNLLQAQAQTQGG
jgi:hypothetical protein